LFLNLKLVDDSAKNKDLPRGATVIRGSRSIALRRLLRRIARADVRSAALGVRIRSSGAAHAKHYRPAASFAVQRRFSSAATATP